MMINYSFKKELIQNEVVEETPHFTFLLDLWLYCQEGDKDFERRTQIHWNEWTLAAEREINSDS